MKNTGLDDLDAIDYEELEKKAIDPFKLEAARPEGTTDDTLATEFSRQHSDNLKYVAKWGKWFLWNGQVWHEEDTLHAFDLARKICREIASQSQPSHRKNYLSSSAVVANVERMAKADRAHAMEHNKWDTDLWVINTPNQLISLKENKLTPHQKTKFITKVTSASHTNAECPNWKRFLNDITGGDQEMQTYLQRVAGYCLTGDVTEEVLFFIYGMGGNGKSVFANTLQYIMGDYATTAPLGMFMASKNEKHPTELARLRGARLVVGSEISEGQRWDESKIKMLTGGDPIVGRFMRGDFFEFEPTHKVLILGNNKPTLSNVDEAIRRRFHLIPFDQTFKGENRDLNLKKKLFNEKDAIFNWALEGCQGWREIGLNPPKKVQEATDEYFLAQDTIMRWLDDKCVIGENSKELTAVLFENWKTWAEGTNSYVGDIKRFGDQLEKHGFTKTKDSQNRRSQFRGLSLG